MIDYAMETLFETPTLHRLAGWHSRVDAQPLWKPQPAQSKIVCIPCIRNPKIPWFLQKVHEGCGVNRLVPGVPTPWQLK